jgi:subtilisin family serine protease
MRVGEGQGSELRRESVCRCANAILNRSSVAVQQCRQFREQRCKFSIHAKMNAHTSQLVLTECWNTDENGHGSHVAGTIGGNTFGVAKAVSLVAQSARCQWCGQKSAGNQ